MKRSKRSLRLFEATGVELEYMIVDRRSLEVRAIADELLKSLAGDYEMSVERGPIAWSNELALHVAELKTNGPTRDLDAALEPFQQNVREMNRRLAQWDAMLLPTAMHPWMDPLTELRLWPHEDSPIYDAFDRIFDCRGHGWANLQSAHINLPFSGDEEFGRLHAAIRLVLPILPAIAASSPCADRRLTGLLDTRLDVYRHNADRVPSVSGVVIPERAFTRREYEERILEPIYADLAPLDPGGLLRHEWVNARGAIAHFGRRSIEIRVLDVQECPLADLAIVAATTAIVRALVEEELEPYASQREWPERDLAQILIDAIRDGSETMIRNERYLAALGWRGGICRASDLWADLISRTLAREPAHDLLWQDPLETILEEGCLARRLRTAIDADSGDMTATYRRLAHCLESGVLFGRDG